MSYNTVCDLKGNEMNIFILDQDIKKSAQYHVDKHCVKMILEHSQMLCTSVASNPELRSKLNVSSVPYKSTHINHPCTLWVNKSHDNFSWLVAYTHELHEEYKYRYGREHKSYNTLRENGIITDRLISHGKIQEIESLYPAKAMPEDCKSDSVVESYRNYYKKYKSEMFSWKNREKPEWV